MDVIVVRRSSLSASPAPFRCACGSIVTGLSPLVDAAKCPSCERPTYHVVRYETTESSDATELVVAAMGVVDADLPAFEAQGFHVVRPEGARFPFMMPPRFKGDLTNADGSLRVVDVR